MGVINVVMNNCLRQPKYFADCFNAILRANGEQFTVQREYLCADETVISGLIGKFSYEKINDTKMILQYNKNEICAMLAIEGQVTIHSGMVARTMIYDAYTYHKQMNALRHYNQAKTKGDELLAGFRKEDTLVPCITAVVYIGKKKWETVKVFQELVDYNNLPSASEHLLKNYGNNSKLLLLDVRHVKQEVIDSMDTELKFLFEMIRRSESKKQMLQYINEQEESFQHLPYVIADAIMTICKFKDVKELLQQTTEGEVNMCKAVRDLRREERSIGKREGIKEGENRLNRLNLILIGKNQINELMRAANEPQYREELYRFYGI